MDHTARVPRWALGPAIAAPLALIGGWTLAADLQPAGYNPVHQTISRLAAHGAHDRWVMTTALAALGLCYLLTAAALYPVRAPGRIMLAVGGAATLAVAAFPQPQVGSQWAHLTAATIGFVALALWPPLGAKKASGALLSLPLAAGASVVLVGLLLWLSIALGGSHLGLAERCLTGAEAIWPLAVVLSLRSRHRRPASPGSLGRSSAG
jgi:hypothetical membrane protein